MVKVIDLIDEDKDRLHVDASHNDGSLYVMVNGPNGRFKAVSLDKRQALALAAFFRENFNG